MVTDKQGSFLQIRWRDEVRMVFRDLICITPLQIQLLLEVLRPMGWRSLVFA